MRLLIMLQKIGEIENLSFIDGVYIYETNRTNLEDGWELEGVSKTPISIDIRYIRGDDKKIEKVTLLRNGDTRYSTTIENGNKLVIPKDVLPGGLESDVYGNVQPYVKNEIPNRTDSTKNSVLYGTYGTYGTPNTPAPKVEPPVPVPTKMVQSNPTECITSKKYKFSKDILKFKLDNDDIKNIDLTELNKVFNMCKDVIYKEMANVKIGKTLTAPNRERYKKIAMALRNMGEQIVNLDKGHEYICNNLLSENENGENPLGDFILLDDLSNASFSTIKLCIALYAYYYSRANSHPVKNQKLLEAIKGVGCWTDITDRAELECDIQYNNINIMEKGWKTACAYYNQNKGALGEKNSKYLKGLLEKEILTIDEIEIFFEIYKLRRF